MTTKPPKGYVIFEADDKFARHSARVHRQSGIRCRVADRLGWYWRHRGTTAGPYASMGMAVRGARADSNH